MLEGGTGAGSSQEGAERRRETSEGRNEQGVHSWNLVWDLSDRNRPQARIVATVEDRPRV